MSRAKVRYRVAGYDATGLRYLGVWTAAGDRSLADTVSALYPALPHLWAIAEQKETPNRVVPIRGSNPFGV